MSRPDDGRRSDFEDGRGDGHDDFENDPEAPDESETDDDNADNATAPCPSCGGEVWEFTDRCPHCGEWITLGSRTTGAGRGMLLWLVVGLIVVGLLLLAR